MNGVRSVCTDSCTRTEQKARSTRWFSRPSPCEYSARPTALSTSARSSGWTFFMSSKSVRCSTESRTLVSATMCAVAGACFSCTSESSPKSLWLWSVRTRWSTLNCR
eukprot:2147084-Prymnesium_polylepis.1